MPLSRLSHKGFLASTSFLAICAVMMTPAMAQTITYSSGDDNTTPIVLTTPGGDTLDVATGAAFQDGTISEITPSSITKTGGGNLKLTTPNTYSGFTNIQGGTLTIGDPQALGTSTVEMSNGVTLNFDTSGTIANDIVFGSGIDGTISALPGANITLDKLSLDNTFLFIGKTGDSGTITLLGGGTVTGANSIVIIAGTLRPGDATAANVTDTAGSELKVNLDGIYDLNGFDSATADLAGSGHITNNGATAATITMDGGLTDTFDGIIQDGTSTTALHVTDNAELILTGANTYTGGTTLDSGGILVGTTASIQGQIVDDGVLVFDQDINGTFSSGISGTGDLVKTNSGTLVLTGNSSFSGTTHVYDGVLSVNGSLANSIIALDNGGTLGGTGTVGGITTTMGSTVAPGNSIGTLHVNGNVAFVDHSTYQVQVNATGQSDRIDATGTTVIDSGSTLQLLPTSGFAANTPYTILTAAGGVTGTFTNLVSSSFAFLSPQVTYNLNDIEVTLVSNSVTFQSLATTPNQSAAAKGAQSLGGGNPVFDAIEGLDIPATQTAFDSLSGEIHASIGNGLLTNAHYLGDAMMGRLRQSDAGSDNPAAHQLAALDPACIETATTPTADRAIWGQAFGSWSQTDGDSNAAKLDNTTSGFVMGLDGEIADGWRLGVAAGYSHSSIDESARDSDASIDGYHIAAYGGGHVGPVALRLGAAYSFNRIDSSRDVDVGSISDHDKASYDAHTAQVFGEIGYDAKIGPVALEPFAGMTYVNVATDGFSEKGGATALHGRSSDQDLPYSTLGLRAGGEIVRLGGNPLTAQGMLGWQHAFGDLTPSSQMKFASGSSDFTVSGTPISRNALVIQAGLDLAVTDALTVGLNYDGQLASDAHENAVQGNVKFQF